MSKPAPAKIVAGATLSRPRIRKLTGSSFERRTQAQSLLSSLATDAGTFKDQRLRARTQARIAEFLWEAETDRASNLFRKAWDAAEIADAESQQELQDEICAQRAKSGGGGGGGGRLSKLADADFDRAVELARVFEREAPRAHAVMAIALTVLTEKKR